MDEVSAALAAKALDGLYLRYQYTAQNIANANTPNYRPVHVSFEDSLRSAAAKGSGAISDVAPKMRLDSGSAEMRLDLELSTASQTAMRYRALLTVLGQQMALHRAVIMDGGK